MRRLLVLALLVFPIAASAQLPRRPADWTQLPAKGCIGGSTCRERKLQVRLEERPVLAVRFHAHDQIGSKAEGVLRVKIDGNTIRGYIDVPRRGELFTIDVEELTGRMLTFEAVSDDEVEISEVAVLYGRVPERRIPRGPDGGGRTPGWRPYPGAALCIGGDGCGRNGTRITVPLEDAPVLGVRFFAHDSVGQRADGKLRVRIDGTTIESYVDVQREGRRHEFDVDGLVGDRLVIETASDDEVEIKDVEVLYGRRTGASYARETTHEGGCIGGADCGGRRARIRIPINGRTVASIRFYARDDIGTRAGGELRIRIDDEVLENYLDIPREGKTFTFAGDGLSGDYVYIEPAADDEVEVKDVRVIFERD